MVVEIVLQSLCVFLETELVFLGKAANLFDFDTDAAEQLLVFGNSYPDRDPEMLVSN